MPPGQGKDLGGEGVSYFQAPRSFPQAPSYFKHSQKDLEGGSRQQRSRPPCGLPLKRGHQIAFKSIDPALGKMFQRGWELWKLIPETLVVLMFLIRL